MSTEYWEPGKTAAVNGISDLLQSTDYFDLTLEIDGKEFKVHKAVLCPRSAVFRVECDGRFSESSLAKIKVGAPAADVKTIERMLRYLYSHQYDDGSTRAQESERSMSTRVDALVEATSSLTIASDTKHSESTHGTENVNPDEGAQQTHRTATKSRAEERIEPLLANIRVYCVADYYNINDLKDLALSKFRSALIGERSSAFAEVVSISYDFTHPDDALRELVLDHVVQNRHHFGKDRKFIEGVLRVDAFMTDFAIQATQAYEEEVTNVTTEMIDRTTTLEQRNIDLVDENDHFSARIKDLERHERQSEGIMSLLKSVSKCEKCPASIDVMVRRNEAPANWRLECYKCNWKHKPKFN